MGYFDGLTNGAFKTDAQGRRLFFLYGALGKGRHLPSEADEIAMRGTFKAFYKFLMFAVLPIVVVAHVFLHMSFSGILILAGLLLLPPYVWLEVKARRYPKVDSRISIGEAYANSASAHNFWTLVFLSGIAFLFVLAGLVIVVVLEGNDRWLGVGAIVFFGACGATLAWMARINARKRRA
jgi:Flp pilus assembly protein TadB